MERNALEGGRPNWPEAAPKMTQFSLITGFHFVEPAIDTSISIFVWHKSVAFLFATLSRLATRTKRRATWWGRTENEGGVEKKCSRPSVNFRVLFGVGYRCPVTEMQSPFQCRGICRPRQGWQVDRPRRLPSRLESRLHSASSAQEEPFAAARSVRPETKEMLIFS